MRKSATNEGVRKSCDALMSRDGLSRWVFILVAMALSTGCVGYDEEFFGVDEFEYPIVEADPETIGAADHWNSTTVAELIAAQGCSTEPTMPLNAQIVRQMNCIEPDFFEDIDDVANIRLGGGANSFLQQSAARALRRVAASNPTATLMIESSWRSVVQQMILHSWQGSCGIGIAATPGRSNHESGLAIDVPSWSRSAFHSSLEANGFVWYCTENNGGREAGCIDAVHYSYRAGGRDLRSRAVLAFQQLWNRAHPEDPIGEDGMYGTETRTRIRQAPLDGFSVGASCSTTLATNIPD